MCQHRFPSKSGDVWAMWSCRERAGSLPVGVVVAAMFGVSASNAEHHAVPTPTPNGSPVTGPSHTRVVALQLMSLRLLVRVMVFRSDSDRPPQMP